MPRTPRPYLVSYPQKARKARVSSEWHLLNLCRIWGLQDMGPGYGWTWGPQDMAGYGVSSHIPTFVI
jgi:hypothetical protein